MPGSITSRELYDEIDRGEVPFILDVRNQDEYAAWRVEGTREVAMRNLPIWLAVEQVEALAQELPENTVVICAHGNGSGLLLEMLAAEGRSVRNLEGGTAAWSELLVPQPLACLPEAMVGWQVLRPAKACISYVIGVPGGHAVVVDPARYPDAYRDLAGSRAMTVTHVIDTHIHADHISGGPALADLVGASYHVPIEDAGRSSTLRNSPLADGAVLDLGGESLHVISLKMPGHTPGSTCIHIPGHLLLTGDTVFVRGLGRPDLTGRAEELAAELFHTIHNRLSPLDRSTAVLPAHWTFASEINAQGLVMTDLGTIFAASLVSEQDMTRFIDEIITSLPSAPDTYDRIRLVNSGAAASADEIEMLEIGKNQCAASTSM